MYRKANETMKWQTVMIRNIVLMTVAAVCLCAGCEEKEAGKKTKNATDVAVSGNPATETSVSGEIVSGGAMAGKSEREKKSREYAEQVAAGLFSPLMENLSAELESQTTEEKLKESWNSVAGELTGYQGIESVSETENENYRIVLVTLRYAGNQGITIKFVYDGESRIAGLWFHPVALHNAGESQKDLPDGSYEEVDITVGRDPYALKGKLTLPGGAGKAPVVILVPGTDNLDMDGTIGSAENKPMRDLARGLASRGVASLRYHKREYQYASTVAEDAGIYDRLLEDVWYAVDAMYNSRQVDGSRIVIAAQGKAADYLPAIVAKKERRLTGAVMLAGKPVQVSENFYAEKEKTVSCNARYFMDTNSTLPLLIMQGERDFETPVKHYEKWQELLKGRSHVTYRSYRSLNHYFLTSAGKTDATDYDKKGSVSQSVIKEIANWLSEVKD